MEKKKKISNRDQKKFTPSTTKSCKVYVCFLTCFVFPHFFESLFHLLGFFQLISSFCLINIGLGGHYNPFTVLYSLPS